MRTKIVVPMLFLALVPTLVISWIAITRIRQLLWQNTRERVAFDVTAKTTDLARFLAGLQEDLLFMGRMESIRALASASTARAADPLPVLRERAEQDLLRYARTKKLYCGVRCLNPSGHELLRFDVRDGKPQVASLQQLRAWADDNDHFLRMARVIRPDHVYLATQEFATADLTPGHKGVVRYMTALPGPPGGRGSILIINICIGHILSRLGPLPAGTEAWLIGEDGTYLGYMGGSAAARVLYAFERHRPASLDYSQAQLDRLLANGGRTGTIELGDRFIAFASLPIDSQSPQRHWTLLIGHPLAVLNAPIRQLTAVFALLAAVVVTLAALLGLFVAHYIARPIAHVRRATQQIASGDLSKSVQITTGDELEGLAADFNRMRERLRDAQERLAQWNVKLEREVARQTGRLHRLQSGLAKADKLATIGQMTASVLHEVGNPLAAFKAKIQVAEEEGGLADTTRRLLADLLKEVNRLTRFLRSFSRIARLPAPAWDQVAPADIADSVATLVRPELKRRGTVLRIRGEATVPFIMGDADQLRQVLINLILNAAEASGPGDPIEVALETAPHGPSGPSVARGARIQVIDHGSGIAEEVRKHIWEPFFSTKSDGTGLGLSICRKIVRDHGGTIRLESTPGQGTTVTMSFPPA